jgi:hypothetical protein
VILKHKAAASDKEGAEADTLDAFVALGGNVRARTRVAARVPVTLFEPLKGCCCEGKRQELTTGSSAASNSAATPATAGQERQGVN